MAFDDGIYTVRQYFESKCTLQGRIAAIDELIDAMMLKALDAVGNSDLAEYQMNDGQMTVRTSYRSVSDVQKGIKDLEAIKQMYVNRLNGRVTSLKSGKF